jgi:hypothetical protein
MTDVLERPVAALQHAARPEPSTATSPIDLVEWVHTDVVEPAVWIGRFKGTFLGMVEEREPEGFVSMTRLGRSLGRFDTLDEAKAAFVAHREAERRAR